MFSLASIATMSACIFLFGLFFAIILNFQYIIRTAEEGVAITVFFEEDATDEHLLKEQVMEVVNELSDREQKIIKLRFGLDGGRPHTLEEVGAEFAVTRERIRQIEAKALVKLRRNKETEKLHDFLK